MTLAYNMAVAVDEAHNEGRCEGAYQKAIETAKKLITLGLTQDQIASVTGLSPEEIEKL